MSITCKAAIGNGTGSFSIEEIEIADPGKDEVLVRMKAAGICHTDHDSLSWGKTLILGHEGAGIVEKTGSGIEGVNVGDKVILNWATPCGHCFQCLEGNQHICEENSPVVAGGNGYTPGHACLESSKLNGEPVLRSFNLGTLSEYALVKSSAVVRHTSDRLSFPAASIISCGVMTGFGSVANAARLSPGATVVVIGTGGVGLNVIQGARISNASRIIAIDLNENRLQMALQFGATDIIQASKDDRSLLKAAEQVKKILKGRMADFAFECTAVPELGASPLLMVRNAGTAVQVSGIEQVISIDMRLFEWDKIYINPLYGKCQPQSDFPKLVRLFEEGSLMLDEMITRTYSLEELPQAFDDMLKGRNAKGVVVF